MSGAAPKVFWDHLEAVTADAERLRDIWEPGGVLEFPYAAAVGGPSRLEGIDAIIGYFSGLGRFEGWSFRDERAWALDGDPGGWLVEVHASATLLDGGGAYEQDYVIRLHENAAGRLDHWREVWDPTRF